MLAILLRHPHPREQPQRTVQFRASSNPPTLSAGSLPHIALSLVSHLRPLMAMSCEYEENTRGDIYDPKRNKYSCTSACLIRTLLHQRTLQEPNGPAHRMSTAICLASLRIPHFAASSDHEVATFCNVSTAVRFPVCAAASLSPCAVARTTVSGQRE